MNWFQIAEVDLIWFFIDLAKGMGILAVVAILYGMFAERKNSGS
jgi:hypothetical protein